MPEPLGYGITFRYRNHVPRQMMANQLTEPSQTYDSPLMTTMVILLPSADFACALTLLFALMALANVVFGSPPTSMS